MQNILSDNERGRLNRLITDSEKRTNAQIVLAVIKRCDDYAELPWKVFSLGVSIAGLFVVILDYLFYSWISSTTVLYSALIILAIGAVFALMAIFIPGFARIFLSANRAEVEVRQYAESLFLKRELFATGRRIGVLLLVSLFERKIIILPDKGLTGRLTEDAMQDIIARMTRPLVKNEISRALEIGLEEISRSLEQLNRDISNTVNELPDQIIEEKGV
ncbi:MAG: TPM domain-containing protein [Bacteroidetes bacterium]|nr:TPM domain-containing protein [Bacteroidota bacterium]